MKLYQRIISSICVDMGGKNTGLLLTQGNIKELPEKHERKGFTLIYPETGLQLSLRDRLAKRHQRRTYKRRRLSKRFLKLILKEKYSGNEKEFLNDFQKIRTFLNRRGYTYITLENVVDIEENIQKLDRNGRKEIIEILGNKTLKADEDFLLQFQKLVSQDINLFKEIIQQANQVIGNKGIQKELKDFIKIIKEIRDYCEEILKSEKEGHKPRKEYLKNIAEDLKRDEFKEVLKKYKLTSLELSNLIGHVANLQLRVLRKYFNDPKMKEKDYWDEKRFEKIFIRYLRSWHVNSKEKEFKNRKELLKSIQKHGVLKTFLNVDPELSIPPYEDQNNRRPPTCKSIHLDEKQLNKFYPRWKEWTEKIIEKVKHQYELENYKNDPDLQFIVEYMEKSRLATSHKKTKGLHVILLQRILDRTSVIDEFRFRLLAKVDKEVSKLSDSLTKTEIREFHESKNKLNEILGEEDANQFIELARKYYAEVEKAKKGLWLPEEKNNICFRCDRKPKQKKNVREKLVEGILGIHFNKESWEIWEDFYKNTNIDGKSKTSSICKNLEDERKNEPEFFKEYWDKFKRSKKYAKNYLGNIEQKEIKKLISLFEKSEKLANLIAEKFNLTEKQKERFNNPFSLAQIYNIMEGDISGFYRTCPACAIENFWRSSLSNIEIDGRIPARAVRLSADTMRPFDGQIARYVERIGQKIAHQKWNQLSKLPAGTEVYIPILVEENRFKFARDIAEIKGSKNIKKLDERLKRFEQKEHDQEERIKKASKGICPYTGEPLGDVGEFDHIIPRSLSKKLYGTIFNSEMNLIYVSPTGNRKKGNQLYSLENLSKKYLEKIFKTSDKEKIIEKISETVNKYNNRQVYYHELNEEEQIHFRLALFEPQLAKRVKSIVVSHYKMRVSGLQGYLVRIIYDNLLKLNEQKKLDLHFDVFSYDAGDSDLYRRRDNLENDNSGKYSLLQKKEKQPPGSHIIDATMLWIHAMDGGDIPTKDEINLNDNNDYIFSLLPNEISLISLASRKVYRRKRVNTAAIFKDSLFAERFLSLIISKNTIGFGFHLKNMLKVDYSHAEYLFDLLKPFITYHQRQVKEKLEYYLEKLKENRKMLYFPFSREKVKEFLNNNVYKENLTNDEENLFNIFTGITYYTLKKDIFNQIPSIDIKGDYQNKFSIELKLPSLKKPLKFESELELPIKYDWQKIISDANVKNALKSKKDLKNLPEEEKDKIIETYFPKTVKNPLLHHPVRKIYSLPTLDKNSASTGFRIQRISKEGRQFHVQAVGETKYSGFGVKDNKINFDLPVFMSIFLKENSLAPTSGYYGKPPKEFVYMDEMIQIPEEIYQNDGMNWVKELWLMPNSKQRMVARMSIDNQFFIKKGILKKDQIDLIPYIMPLEFKKKDEEKNETLSEKIASSMIQYFKEIKFEPNIKVNLYSANKNHTTFEFIVRSTSSTMINWYNQAYAKLNRD